jgi:hypothetical protein
MNAARHLGFQCEYGFKSQYPSLTHALQNEVPPIISVDAATLYQQWQPIYAKHDIVLVEIRQSKIVYHDPEAGSTLSVSPDIFKEAWQQAKSEVILTWPVEKTFMPKLKK